MMTNTFGGLSPAKQEIARRMQGIGFGKICDLQVVRGEPVLERAIILRRQKLTRRHVAPTFSPDFVLKTEHIAFFETLDEIHDGVKRYKDLRGTSLKDAKNFIEELTERLRQQAQETFVATPGLDELTELIYAGQKLQAIQRCRELQAMSLFDAKQFIEQLTDDLRQKFPEKFSIRSTTGCAGVFALVAITLAATAAVLMMFLNLNL